MTSNADPRFARPKAAADLPDATLTEVNRLWTIVRAFSNVAHDVNNALQVIAGNAELLAAQPIADDVARRVETMRTQAVRAGAVVERLLKYARTEDGPRQAIDVWPIVEAAVALRTASLNRRRVRLSAERGDARPLIALADHVVLLQALLDLLLAAESHPTAEAGARIVVRASHREKGVAVDVVLTEPTPAVRPTAGHRTPAERAPESAPDRTILTRGGELWAAAHLAAHLGGEVTIAERHDQLTLSMLLQAGE